MCVGGCGKVTLRNVIITLPEPRTTSIQKDVINYVYSENVYLMFWRCNKKRKKAEIFKQLKDVKTFRAV